mgnify:CR=1 FL=1|tara:strand:- start:10404 stop:11306 length:903 start_codon:yes stop_codon:yes gene_type:complete
MLINNLKITTITIDTKINNISFNEKELNEDIINKLKYICHKENSKILKISSNFIDPEIESENYINNHKKSEIIINPLIKKRGRKKKDLANYYIKPRKKQGNGKNFNSQITFMIQSMINENKLYNIKLFRTGSVGVPGIYSIEDITNILNYLVNELKYVFNNNDLHLGPVIPKMINYKTFFTIPPNYILNYYKLKNLLNNNCSDLLFIPVLIQKDKNNCLSIRPKFINNNNEKKSYLIEMFLSGKVNIKGNYPKDKMHSDIKIIEKYLFHVKYNILRPVYKSYDEINNILNLCSSEIIEYD